jgi:hypothetical protein
MQAGGRARGGLMFDHLGPVLSAALSLITLATFTGLALQRSVVTRLREQLQDADAEVARVKASRAEDQAEAAEFRAEAQTRIAQLESDNAALQRVVTGEVHWVALGTRLEDAIALLTAIKEYITRRMKDSP